MIAEFSKRSRRVIALSAATFLTPFALVGAAHAAGADAAADPAPAAADGGGLGDIVVTATRRSESVQKVPISMQALFLWLTHQTHARSQWGAVRDHAQPPKHALAPGSRCATPDPLASLR
jgi:hypothetical protein